MDMNECEHSLRAAAGRLARYTDLVKFFQRAATAAKNDVSESLRNCLSQMSIDDGQQFASEMYWKNELWAKAVSSAWLSKYSKRFKPNPAALDYKCTTCGHPIIVRVNTRSDLKGFQHPVEMRRTHVQCKDCQAAAEERNKQRTQEQRTIALSIKTLRAMPYRDYLQTDHWKRTRRSALYRSAYRCQLCNSGGFGNREILLDVHHRTYENIGQEKPEDLTVLCRICHEKFHDITTKNQTAEGV